MALQKLPGGREKPWHQDKAYFTQSLDTLCVGVWIAMDDATLENGCMRIMDGGHHHGPYAHFQRRDWQICDTDVHPQRCIGVPLKSGGCLFFHSMLPHGTPVNSTNQSRRALQYHYVPADAVEITEQERQEIWGGDGRNLTC
jgi:phytanoyl-CoA hydroxylase